MSLDKDDSDYLAFKETHLVVRTANLRVLNFFVQRTSEPVAPHSQFDWNLLYDDNKYANRTIYVYL